MRDNAGSPEVPVAEARRPVLRHSGARPPAAAQRVRARQRDQLPHLHPQPRGERAQVRRWVIACMHTSIQLNSKKEIKCLHDFAPVTHLVCLHEGRYRKAD